MRRGSGKCFPRTKGGGRLDGEAREKLLKAGAIAGEARQRGMELVSPSVQLLEIAEEIEDFISKKGGSPAFPVNIGIGNVAAHFTPGASDGTKFPKTGIVKFDVGVHVDGYIADTAGTVSLGSANVRLVQVPKEALESAIMLIRPGASLRSIGLVIENTIRAAGFRPVSNLTGHSIERYQLHAGFSVYNTGGFERDEQIPSEMVMAVEPFATDGRGYVVSGRGGNIYSLLERKKLRDEALNELQLVIEERFSTLPFAERWLQDFPNRKEMLTRLVRQRVLHNYDVLLEAGGGAVSQWEHTLIVDEQGARVTT